MVITFREVIGTAGERHVQELINGFSCLDDDVEQFLKTKAYEHEKRNKSRTYLIIDNASDSLIAYYTLSLKTLEFDASVSKTTIKSIDGFNKNASSVPVMLIGQFGKDKNTAKYIDGVNLFNSCLSSVYTIHNLVGRRIVLLECSNDRKILDFYKRNGFFILKEDDADKFIQMVKIL